MSAARSDDDLLHAAAVGDRDALEELLDRHGAQVRKKITGRIDKRWQGVLSEDDVLQETYVEAFLEIRTFEPRGIKTFISWLATMARRNLIDAVRELQAVKRGGDKNRVPIDAEPSDDSYVNLFEMLGGSSTSPSAAARRNEARRAMDDVFQRLPKSYRLVVSLYELAGCTAADVAEASGCSVGAMHMRRKRALAMLRELLQSRSSM